MRRLAVLLVALACAACSGEKATFDAADGPLLVLRDNDVSKAYVVFDRGLQGRADAFPRTSFDPAANGRIGGWKARYRRVPSSRRPGAVVIESKVDLFDSDKGAERDFAAVREGVEKNYVTDDPRLRNVDLGDEAVAGTVALGSGRFTSRLYVVAWRDANANAWVVVNGLEPLPFGAVERLARKQAAHLDARR